MLARDDLNPTETYAACTRCMSPAAARWCRSRAMTCRCNTPPACSGNTCIPARAPACSTSRIWARSRCGRNPARSRTPRWRWSGWCRRTSSRSHRDGSATRSSPTKAGGILDDLMVANFGSHLFLVVNAACKAADEAHLRAHLSDACVIEPLPDRALIALQGPKAESVLAKFCADAPAMRFMDAGPRRVDGIDCFVSRSGYTGEDGFEISVPAEHAERLAKTLLDEQRRAADRTWRARQPAARGRALPLRPRHRHHDDAGRGRAGMVDSKEPPQGRRASPADFPARTRFSRQLETWRAAPPRRLEARRPRAGARRRGAVRRCRLVRTDRRGHLGRLWPEPQCAGRDGLSAVAHSPRPAHWCLPKCAASACRCRSRRCPSFPTPTNADKR